MIRGGEASLEDAVKIAELMTQDVEAAQPDDTLETAARMMADLDVGVLPVCDGKRLVGMLTDRDITVRGIAEGLDAGRAAVREIMSTELRFCREEDDVESVARQMAEWQVRRVPVLDAGGELIGIVSLGDMATLSDDEAEPAEALRGVSESSAEHAGGQAAYAGSKPGADAAAGAREGEGTSDASGIGATDLKNAGF
jgi:CBS domain-containing protein